MTYGHVGTVLVLAIALSVANFYPCVSENQPGVKTTINGIRCTHAYGWPDRAVWSDGSSNLERLRNFNVFTAYNAPEVDIHACAWNAYIAILILCGCFSLGRTSRKSVNGGLPLKMHLSTAMILYLLAAGMLGLNLLGNGWPRMLFLWGSCCGSTFCPWNAVADVFVEIQFLTLIWYLCERSIRNRS